MPGGAPPDVVKNPDNKLCADCNARAPQWASVSLGILICETCSGIHRSLGTHITTVKSTKLDNWKDQWIATARAIGNVKSNAYYEYNVPEGAKYITNVNSATAGGDRIDNKEARKLEAWIRAKYEAKKYALPGVDPPSIRLARGESLSAPAAAKDGEKKEKKHKKDKKDKAQEEAAPPASQEPVLDSPGGEDQSKKQRKKRGKEDGGAASRDVDLSGWDAGAAFGDNAWGGAGMEPSQQQSGFPQFQAPMEQAVMSWAMDHQVFGQYAEIFWQTDGNKDGFVEGDEARALFTQSSLTEEDLFNIWVLCDVDQDMRLSLEEFVCAVHLVSQRQQGAALPAALPPDFMQVVGSLASEYRAYLEQQQMHPQQQQPQNLQQPLPQQLPQQQYQQQEGQMPMQDPQQQMQLQQTQQQPQVQEVWQAPPLPAQAQQVAQPPTQLAPSQPQPFQPVSQLAPARQQPVSLGSGPPTAPASQSGDPVPDFVGVALQSMQWQLDQETFRQYTLIFNGLDRNKDGLVDAADAWDLFALSSLPQQELLQVCQMCGISQQSGLSLEQFASAFHLVACRKQGTALPNTLPVQLVESAKKWALPLSAPASALEPRPVLPLEMRRPPREPAAEAELAGGALEKAAGEGKKQASVWVLGHETFAKYVSIFQQLDQDQDGLVEGREARFLFDQSGVDPVDLVNVWKLCDMNNFGRLTLQEFACAIHLVARRKEGVEIPAALPPELMQDAATLAAEHRSLSPSVPARSSPQSQSAATPATASGSPGAAGAAGAPGQERSMWSIDPGTFAKYAHLFRTLDSNQDGLVDGPDARALFDKSGVDAKELAYIWSLADASKYGCLTLVEFACATHLVAHRRQGADLPTQMPVELVHSASALAASDGEVATPSPGSEAEKPPSAGTPSLPVGQLQADFDKAVGRPKEALPPEALPSGSQKRLDLVQKRIEVKRLQDAMLALRSGYYAPLQERKDEGSGHPNAATSMSQLSTRATLAPGAFQTSTSDFHSTHPEFMDTKQAASHASIVPGPMSVWAESAPSPSPQSTLPLSPPVPALPSSPAATRVALESDPFTLLAKEALGANKSEMTRNALDAPSEPADRAFKPTGIMIDWAKSAPPPPFPVESCPFPGAAGGFTSSSVPPAGEKVVDTPPAEAPELLKEEEAPTPPSPWELDAETFTTYAKLFCQTDQNQDGYIEGLEARQVLSRSQLDSEELGAIWELCDVPPIGRLKLEGFVCAMHLVEQRRGGFAIPSALPQELGKEAARRAAEFRARHPSPWQVTPEELERYTKVYADLSKKRSDKIEVGEAQEVLARTQLLPKDLFQIWSMSDGDGDGSLTPRGFVCAMHLAFRRQQGFALPPKLPDELVEAAGRARAVPQMSQKSVDFDDVPQSFLQALESRDEKARKWGLDAKELESYRAIFAGSATFREDARFMGKEEYRNLLGQVDVPQAEIPTIWRLCDVDRDGYLTLGEFACAMHLANGRAKGRDLPDALPPQLGTLAAMAVAVVALSAAPHDEASEVDVAPWAISPEQLANYRAVFDEGAHDDPIAYSGEEARAVLERSELPNDELHKIWLLSDVDKDQRLTFGEFACALHLASRRRQGLDLPSELPPELAPLPAMAVLLEPGSEVIQEGSLWIVEPDNLVYMQTIFEGADKAEQNILGPNEAREVLERSELPQKELLHIWRLSDIDGDGNLTFGEFACAMHLVCRRRQGHEVPPTLPAELMSLAMMAAAVMELRPPSPSPWAMSPQQLQRYRELFESLEHEDPGLLSAAEAKEVLETSELPHAELGIIWQLSDVDDDGQLTVYEFAIAAHFINGRRQGLELPEVLPAELQPQELAALEAFVTKRPNKLLPQSGTEVLAEKQTEVPAQTPRDAEASVSPWLVDAPQLRQYLALFAALNRADPLYATSAEVKDLFEKSGLPPEDLGRIWFLSDFDEDKQLSEMEFVCALHLICRRRQGHELPPELPQELADLLSHERTKKKKDKKKKRDKEVAVPSMEQDPMQLMAAVASGGAVAWPDGPAAAVTPPMQEQYSHDLREERKEQRSNNPSNLTMGSSQPYNQTLPSGQAYNTLDVSPAQTASPGGEPPMSPALSTGNESGSRRRNSRSPTQRLLDALCCRTVTAAAPLED